MNAPHSSKFVVTSKFEKEVLLFKLEGSLFFFSLYLTFLFTKVIGLKLRKGKAGSILSVLRAKCTVYLYKEALKTSFTYNIAL